MLLEFAWVPHFLLQICFLLMMWRNLFSPKTNFILNFKRFLTMKAAQRNNNKTKVSSIQDSSWRKLPETYCTNTFNWLFKSWRAGYRYCRTGYRFCRSESMGAICMSIGVVQIILVAIEIIVPIIRNIYIKFYETIRMYLIGDPSLGPLALKICKSWFRK